MHLHETMSEDAILTELGHRLERHRVERNRTQAELAEEAGIGRATLQRIERGDSVQMTSLVKLLRALELLGALDAAVPESIAFPIAELERQQRRGRRRARGRHGGPTPAPDEQPWGWGADPGTGA
ncbi:MAG TPA: helix-turn-helix transcriptional regulator [Conexibacter sp.]|nr:helix-turn-helix transcriptional regulator [Conexibacter sp.]